MYDEEDYLLPVRLIEKNMGGPILNMRFYYIRKSSLIHSAKWIMREFMAFYFI